MAKKAKQLKITEVADVVPDAVQDAVDTYVDTLRNRQATQTLESEQRERVIALMKEHGLERVEIDAGEKDLVLVHNERVKIKKKGESGED
jgi:hypothetical protein